MISREPCSRLPRSRPLPAVSGGSWRRSIDSTSGEPSGLLANGPDAMKATMPPTASRVRKPTVASRPTINRRMPSLRPRSGFDEIGPKGLYRVKHGRRRSIEPIVAHQHGCRQAADRTQTVIEVPHGKPQVGLRESRCGDADLELRPECQSAQADPLDVTPSEAAITTEAQRDTVGIDRHLWAAIAGPAQSQKDIVAERQGEHGEYHEARIVQRQCRCIGGIAGKMQDRCGDHAGRYE